MSLEGLNPEQKRAAVHLETPLAVLAGAGTGKTRTMIARLAYLLREGVKPWQICALTFTHKAANEMKDRLETTTTLSIDHLHIGTFHGRAAYWLRRVSARPNFTIVDESDRARMLKALIRESQNENEAPLTYSVLRSDIDAWQNEGLWPDGVLEKGFPDTKARSFEIYLRYVNILERNNLVDFGHLLIRAIRAIEAKPEHPSLQVKHIVVDEYQDTSPVQLELLRAIARNCETIAVVGDDDQAIYGWRGAAPDTMANFIHEFENVEVIKLEHNYRSHAKILDASNALIARNRNRLGKTLFSERDIGPMPMIIRYSDDRSEARKCAHAIHKLIHDGENADEIAVLYRKNAMSRALEDALSRSSIEYKIIGGVRFFERKEIKDVLSTLKAIVNPSSVIDIQRWIENLKIGLGKVSLGKIEAFHRSSTEELSFIDHFSNPECLSMAGLGKAAIKKCLHFAHRYTELKSQIKPNPKASLIPRTPMTLADTIRASAEELDLFEKLAREQDGLSRIENIHALVSAAHAYTEDMERFKEDVTLEGFLERVSLESSSDERQQMGQVALMTIHAAKGLEFKHVFIIGLEEHSFPTHQAVEAEQRGEYDILEEERRLMYVAMTRAKETLKMSFAERRLHQGQIRQLRPSRFLREIPGGHLESLSSTRSGLNDTYSRARKPSSTRAKRVSNALSNDSFDAYDQRPEHERRAHTSKRDRQNHTSEKRLNFSEGQKVSHARFGLGVIVGFRDLGRRQAAMVRFEGTHAPKVVTLEHLKRPAQKRSESLSAAPVHEGQGHVDYSFDFGC